MREDYIKSQWSNAEGNWAYGNQRKCRENGIWIKEDSKGWQEGAAEYLATQVLKSSNASGFAVYEMGTMLRNEKPVHISISPDFLSGYDRDKVDIVYAIDLLEQHYRRLDSKRNPIGWEGVYNRLTKGMSNKQLIQNFVNVISEETGLPDFGGYFTQLCELDALIRNVDRHLRNIAVLNTPEGYTYCPIFDNGGSFGAVLPTRSVMFSDRSEDNIFSLLKPYGVFGSSFERIVDACRELYGPRLQVLSSLNLDNAFTKVEEAYDEVIAEKTRNVWLRSKGLHGELFVDRLTQQPINGFYLTR